MILGTGARVFAASEDIGVAFNASSASSIAGEKVTIVVRCSAVSGTSPTLDLEPQWGTSLSVATTDTDWIQVGAEAIPQITAVGTITYQMTVGGSHLRFVAVVGGSATPTVTVDWAIIN
jgi:hypothetical protein